MKNWAAYTNTSQYNEYSFNELKSISTILLLLFLLEINC